MIRLVAAQARPEHKLYLEFSDGVRGELDLSTRLFGPVFAPLRDDKLFAQVTIDEFGAPCWPNGADLAPDAAYETLRSGQLPHASTP